MNRRDLLQSVPALAFIAAPLQAQMTSQASSAPAGAVYELRVYHCYEGKLETLLTRFREHTMTIFERHGIHNVAYWTPTDDPLKGKTLIYLISHPSRDAATKNWQAFRDDPEWQKVQSASEANGKIVEKVDSTFMTLTDFSPHI
ncbi:NIPSNAP family protein [Acidisarcina polymorpha]|nr:NIPSNAP family protein [Acidisarcina polymorpha]